MIVVSSPSVSSASAAGLPPLYCSVLTHYVLKQQQQLSPLYKLRATGHWSSAASEHYLRPEAQDIFIEENNMRDLRDYFCLTKNLDRTMLSSNFTRLYTAIYHNKQLCCLHLFFTDIFELIARIFAFCSNLSHRPIDEQRCEDAS